MNTLNQLIDNCTASIGLMHVESARDALDRLWAEIDRLGIVKGHPARERAHQLGNDIQVLIFQQYSAGMPDDPGDWDVGEPE